MKKQNKMPTLNVGTKIDVFEKDGFETVEAVVVDEKDQLIVLKPLNHVDYPFLIIPKSSCKINVSITTKGNSLQKYASDKLPQ